MEGTPLLASCVCVPCVLACGSGSGSGRAALSCMHEGTTSQSLFSGVDWVGLGIPAGGACTSDPRSGTDGAAAAETGGVSAAGSGEVVAAVVGAGEVFTWSDRVINLAYTGASSSSTCEATVGDICRMAGSRR